MKRTKLATLLMTCLLAVMLSVTAMADVSDYPDMTGWTAISDIATEDTDGDGYYELNASSNSYYTIAADTNWYLDVDVELNCKIYITGEYTFNLCLNDNVMTADSDYTGPLIYVTAGSATVNICGGNGDSTHYGEWVDGSYVVTDTDSAGTATELTGGVIAGAYNSGYGGAIQISTSSDLYNPILNIDGVTFAGNTATSGGGAIYYYINNSVNTATATIDNSTFVDNTTTGNGGAIYAYAKAADGITITGSTFTDNSATKNSTSRGGAICLHANTQVNISDTTFTGNSAYTGGAIAGNSASYPYYATFDTITVTDNYAYSSGGGIYIDQSSVVTLKNSDISDNEVDAKSATYTGGGIYVYHSTLTMDETTVTGNTAYHGGGMYVSGNSSYAYTVTITDSDISNNTYKNYGGGIYFSDSYGTASIGAGEDGSGTTIQNNEPIDDAGTTNGGGIYNVGSLTLGDVTITGNTANGTGGGVYDNGTITLDGEIDITNNDGTEFHENLYLLSGKLLYATTDFSTGSTIDLYNYYGNLPYSGTETILVQPTTEDGATLTEDYANVFTYGDSVYDVVMGSDTTADYIVVQPLVDYYGTISMFSHTDFYPLPSNGAMTNYRSYYLVKDMSFADDISLSMAAELSLNDYVLSFTADDIGIVSTYYDIILDSDNADTIRYGKWIGDEYVILSEGDDGYETATANGYTEIIGGIITGGNTNGSFIANTGNGMYLIGGNIVGNKSATGGVNAGTAYICVGDACVFDNLNMAGEITNITIGSNNYIDTGYAGSYYDSYVGVTLAEGSPIFAIAPSETSAANFFSDDPAYSVAYGLANEGTENEIAVLYLTERTFTYTATGNTITAVDEEDDDFLGGTVYISAPTGTTVYDDSAVSVDVVKDGIFADETIEITYTKDGVDYDGTLDQAGTYVATITCGDATATSTFTISKAAVTFTVTGNSFAAGEYSEPTITSDPSLTADDDYTVAYLDEDGEVVALNNDTEAGTYTIEITMIDTNYKVSGTVGSVVVTAADIVLSTYTVSFGEDASTTAEAIATTIRILPEPTANDGYTFTGWSYDGKLYAAGAEFVQPEANVEMTATWVENTFTVSGTVYAKDGTTPVSDATVTLKDGTTDTTDADGKFSFSDVAMGGYDISATNGTVTTTTYVYVSADTTVDKILLDFSLTTSVEVETGLNTTTIANLDKTAETIVTETNYENGDTVEIKLIVSSANDATAEAEIAAESEDVGYIMDISVKEILNNTTVTPITETDDLIHVTVDLPAEMQGMAYYTVLRYHNGTVDTLTTNANTDGEKIELVTTEIDGVDVVTAITIHAKKFSVYAFTSSTTVPSSGTTSYYTSKVADTDNGTVAISSTRNKSNATVTITVTPDDSYEVGDVTVTYSSTREVTVTDNGDGTYSYKQPSYTATVTVTFVEIDTEDEDALPFTDLDESEYYMDAIAWAVDAGVTTGKTETTFAPYDITTRAQAVTFLYRAMTEPDFEIENPFGDLEVDQYYVDAVLWAYENGITIGTSDTAFSPDMDCTRAHIITFLWRMMGEPVVNSINLFTDVDVDDYYYNAVLWAVGAGITNGTSDTTFSPDEDCTRADIVTFLYRALAE